MKTIRIAEEAALSRLRPIPDGPSAMDQINGHYAGVAWLQMGLPRRGVPLSVPNQSPI
jgi:hypothetical protein